MKKAAQLTPPTEPQREIEKELLTLDNGKLATIEHLVQGAIDPITMFDKFGNGFGKFGNGFSKFSF